MTETTSDERETIAEMMGTDEPRNLTLSGTVSIPNKMEQKLAEAYIRLRYLESIHAPAQERAEAFITLQRRCAMFGYWEVRRVIDRTNERRKDRS